MRILFALLLSTALFASSELDRMIGQMIMVGFHGTSTKDDWVKQIAGEIKNGEIGGVVLFAHNIKNPDQLRFLNETLSRQGSKYPPFIAVDEEGGKVERLVASKGFESSPSAKTVGTKTPSFAESVYRNMACELRGYGINLNFAPVVDLELEKNSEIIAKLERSFSSRADQVVEFATRFVKSHEACGVATTLKHFPGHGTALLDTHKTSVDLTGFSDKMEMIPYQKMIKNGFDQLVMMSHIVDLEIDDLPASLSKEHIKNLLDIGFDGLVVSDDFQMKAITDEFTLEEIVLGSIEAGVDILLFSNYFDPDPSLPQKIKEIVKTAIEEGKIDQARVEKSYKKITQFKKRRYL